MFRKYEKKGGIRNIHDGYKRNGEKKMGKEIQGLYFVIHPCVKLVIVYFTVYKGKLVVFLIVCFKKMISVSTQIIIRY